MKHLEHNPVIQSNKCSLFSLRMQFSWLFFFSFSRILKSFWLLKTLIRGVSEILRCVTWYVPLPLLHSHQRKVPVKDTQITVNLYNIQTFNPSFFLNLTNLTDQRTYCLSHNVPCTSVFFDCCNISDIIKTRLC